MASISSKWVLAAASALVAGAGFVACKNDSTSPPAPETFVATMNGANERPTAKSVPGTGTATFTVNGSAINYTITVNNMTGVTGAHIHPGDANSTGGVIVPFPITGTPTGAVNGQLTSGSFTAADIKAATQGGTPISMDSLLTLMRTSNAYVNVHTSANPGGEIRGQIVKQP